MGQWKHCATGYQDQAHLRLNMSLYPRLYLLTDCTYFALAEILQYIVLILDHLEEALTIVARQDRTFQERDVSIGFEISHALGLAVVRYLGANDASLGHGTVHRHGRLHIGDGHGRAIQIVAMIYGKLLAYLLAREIENGQL